MTTPRSHSRSIITNGRTESYSEGESYSGDSYTTGITQSYTTGISPHVHYSTARMFPDRPPCPTCGAEICPVCKKPSAR